MNKRNDDLDDLLSKCSSDMNKRYDSIFEPLSVLAPEEYDHAYHLLMHKKLQNMACDHTWVKTTLLTGHVFDCKKCGCKKEEI